MMTTEAVKLRRVEATANHAFVTQAKQALSHISKLLRESGPYVRRGYERTGGKQSRVQPEEIKLRLRRSMGLRRHGVG
jgi:hypothetical protein